MSISKIYCRVFQVVFKYCSYVLPWRKPEILKGSGALYRLSITLQHKKINNVLIITDSFLEKTDSFNELVRDLTEQYFQVSIYSKTVPNPTINNVDEAYSIYKENGCQGIIAFGGGSPMDCAKGVGIRVAHPFRKLSSFKGTLKVLKKIPYLVAIPTTSGTGSEVTVTTVISNPATHEKYPINDLCLIPSLAVLDPELTVALPQHLTATTGMDALTHAVEAYIGRSNTKETAQNAIKATCLVLENIEIAYKNGTDIIARENMLEAAHLAGLAFTRAYVGYVHAIAHSLGGMYGTPHGLANAVILPIVLEYYGEAAEKRIAELAIGSGFINESVARVTNDSDITRFFIQKIRTLNKLMNIPETISDIKEDDIPLLAKRALAEANPLYPVPTILGKKEMEQLYKKVAGLN